jgi:hypothetical protein
LVSYWATALAVAGFGIAMGYLEAAVVVYLRAAIEAGAVAAAQDPTTTGTYETLEVAREAATLVMIATVGWLAGRAALERLAWTAVVFGLWDIVYYAGLRLAIGWPEAFDTWDLLFLIPWPWVGPVWAPILVSGALIAVGLAATHRLRHGRSVTVVRWQVAAALAGGLLVIGSFLVDGGRVATGDLDAGGAWTGWPLYWAGMVAAAIASGAALRGPVQPDTNATASPNRDRPPAGRPPRPPA